MTFSLLRSICETAGFPTGTGTRTDSCIRLRSVPVQGPLLLRHRTVGDVDHVIWIDRFGEVVVRPQPDRLLGGLYGRVPGDDHHLGLGPSLLDGLENRHAVHPGHAKIEQHHIGGAALPYPPGLLSPSRHPPPALKARSG